jgi:hypothetical protein
VVDVVDGAGVELVVVIDVDVVVGIDVDEVVVDVVEVVLVLDVEVLLVDELVVVDVLEVVVGTVGSKAVRTELLSTVAARGLASPSKSDTGSRTRSLEPREMFCVWRVRRATLTLPVGEIVLAWAATKRVVPLAKVAGFVVGAVPNSLVVPPAIETTWITAGS